MQTIREREKKFRDKSSWLVPRVCTAKLWDDTFAKHLVALVVRFALGVLMGRGVFQGWVWLALPCKLDACQL